MKNIIHTTKASLPIGYYVQGILLNKIFFISVQIPINPFIGLITLGINKQTFQVLENIRYILKKKFFISKI
ncbi:hypothetical protein GJT93_00750 [Enterobacteriaceae endosymbiont of Donacia provostii]|uniref:Rid family hydrolase n=1 Tax=Enterobacteriaceae endosymbiont of Donacia provostii TaxID=2675781 RepID=UPI0014495835|nr:Rid family hydrolase [Enterobacteriaceae endosymbiont of Donacia provostii]QJC33642.1 hypothetical protein GJT93_00750 [Enterobacteriaceae endosymbiont of Donacia provostii]